MLGAGLKVRCLDFRRTGSGTFSQRTTEQTGQPDHSKAATHTAERFPPRKGKKVGSVSHQYVLSGFRVQPLGCTHMSRAEA